MKILKIAKEKAQERVQLENMIHHKLDLLKDLKKYESELEKIKRVENEEMSQEFKEIINSRKREYQEAYSALNYSLKEADKIIKRLKSPF